MERTPAEGGLLGIPWFTEGLFVAISPAFGYFMAFQYERGYADHFRIPTAFIEISTDRVIYITLGLLTTLFFVFLYGHVLLALRPSPRDPPWKRMAGALVIGGVVVCSLVIAAEAFWWSEIGALLFLFLLAATVERKFPQVSRDGDLYRVVRQRLVIVAGILFVLLGWSYHLGRRSAEMQETFLTCGPHEGLVALQVYADRWICVGYDTSTRIVPESYRMVLVDDVDTAVFKRVHVGPLRPPLRADPPHTLPTIIARLLRYAPRPPVATIFGASDGRE